MVCPKCKNNNVVITENTYTEKKNRSCLWNIFMFCITGGLWLIWMLIRNNSNTVHDKRCLCQTCGYSWSIR